MGAHVHTHMHGYFGTYQPLFMTQSCFPPSPRRNTHVQDPQQEVRIRIPHISAEMMQKMTLLTVCLLFLEEKAKEGHNFAAC